MKKIGILFIFVLTLFLGIEGVSAKTVVIQKNNVPGDGKACDYIFKYEGNTYSYLLNYSDNTITLYSNPNNADTIKKMSKWNVTFNNKSCDNQIYYDDSNFKIYEPKLYLKANPNNLLVSKMVVSSDDTLTKKCWIKKDYSNKKWSNNIPSGDYNFVGVKTESECNLALEEAKKNNTNKNTKTTNVSTNATQKTYSCYIKNDYSDCQWSSTSPGSDYFINPAPQSSCASICTQNRPYVEKYDNVVNVGNDSSNTLSCGNGTIKNIPRRIVKIVNTVISVIQVAVPILLIILGMIDLGKSVLGQKEDEIKKGQKVFISRLITGILVFFVIFVVKIAVRFVNEASDSSNIISCVDCFIQGNCE